MDANTTSQQINPVRTTSQEPVVNSPIPNQKGFVPLIAGIIIFLIVAVGGAYYFGRFQVQRSQTQNSRVSSQSPQSKINTNSFIPTSVDETTNWKAYINDTYKYTLKIPNDWIIDSNNAKQNNIFTE